VIDIQSESGVSLIIPLYNLRLTGMDAMGLDDACIQKSNIPRDHFPHSSSATYYEATLTSADLGNSCRSGNPTDDSGGFNVWNTAASLLTPSPYEGLATPVVLIDAFQTDGNATSLNIAGADPIRSQGSILDLKLYSGEDPRDAFDKALIIFKLFKPNMAHANIFFCYPSENPDKAHLFLHYQPWERIRDYVIDRSEVSNFKSFWKIFRRKKLKSFAVARFHTADYEPYYVDRIVNYVIALESLCYFKFNRSKSKIGYGEKIKKIGARILSENTGGNREKIETILHDFYKLRSSIVHNNKRQEQRLLEKRSLRNWLLILKNFTRLIIIYYGKADLLHRHDERHKHNKDLYLSSDAS